ncbi:hypothetical protein [Streptomyces spiramenti]|uniref:Divalent-cation tolerance protein CutA n=1 Tax=Streptomyces spiramenti TaxID=2720606 RepID=A0ABX1AIA0_9ACTN|nr:hypothetical protein [Streptomyces spiramenti]NJP65113.1 hypothetical protein [Streptomyces spiramenti]
MEWDLLIVIATPHSENEDTLADLITPYARASLEHWVGSCFDEVPDI